MVHVRLLFLQPDLCDVRSYSLLFVGALDEFQHFIWSLGWIEWGKFRCKALRVFIFGPIILSCIKRGRVGYKNISPYGNLHMYMGHVFIERLVGWRQWLLLLSTCQCLPMHDDVIKWKHFPRYWPFLPVNSPHKGQWRGALMFTLICPDKRLSKQSLGWWFETLSHSLWRHHNVTCTSPGYNKLNWSTVLGDLCLELVCLWSV